jgi:hypothetical protein
MEHQARQLCQASASLAQYRSDGSVTRMVGLNRAVLSILEVALIHGLGDGQVSQGSSGMSAFCGSTERSSHPGSAVAKAYIVRWYHGTPTLQKPHLTK